jgi:hypothetical protein
MLQAELRVVGTVINSLDPTSIPNIPDPAPSPDPAPAPQPPPDAPNPGPSA